MHVRGLFAAALALVTAMPASGADLPAKAPAVQYVKVCSLYGDGFYYIPGTDTCLKIGGYVRVQVEYNAGAGGIVEGSANGGGSAVEVQEGRFARDVSNDVNYRTRTALSVDVRQQTQYGILRSYFRVGIQVTSPSDTEAAGNTFWDRAFIQFAGFTVGKAISFFDLFTYSGAYSYHDPRVPGDTTIANGVTVWAYTATFGNGFSGTLSLESPLGHNRQPVIDATAPGFFAVNGAIAGDLAFANQPSSTGSTLNGFRAPDIVGNLRLDQAWGYVGVSAAVHEASGAYYLTPNLVNNGHPADRYGWAAAVGGKLNLPGGDMVGANFCYTEGAVGFCSRQGVAQLYNASTSVAASWLTDGVFTTGTDIQLTRVWSVLAAYEHVWNPQWRTSIFGGYANVDYNSTATGILNSALVAGSVCARPFAGIIGNLTAIRADPGNSCNPDFSFWEAGTRTQWNPVPQLDIGFELLYTRQNTSYKGPALYAVNLPRPAVPLMDDQNIWTGLFRWQRNFYP